MKDDREDIEARIAAFLDGQLSPEEAARLEVFLANTDEKLSARVLSMLHDKHALQSLPKPKAPDELTARIMEAVERTSLLHGVEHLAHPQRRWWHSRAAVAAGLILVMGGFTYFIVQSFYRPTNQWHNLVADGSSREPTRTVVAPPDALLKAKDAGDRIVAQSELAAHRDADKILEGTALAKADGARAAGGSARGGAGGDALPGSSPKTGAFGVVQSKSTPAPVITATLADHEALVGQQLARAQENAKVPYETALRRGYVPADSPQAALAAVSADPRPATAASPILLTLIARDPADPQRLRALLETFMAQDPNLTTQQAALYDRVNNYATLNTTSSLGISSLNLSGGIAANGPATVGNSTVPGTNAKFNNSPTYTAGTALPGNLPGNYGGNTAPGNTQTFAGGAHQPATSPAIITSSAGATDLKQSQANNYQSQQLPLNNSATNNYNNDNNANSEYYVYNARKRAFDPLANGTSTPNGSVTLNGTANLNTLAPTPPAAQTAQNTARPTQGQNDYNAHQFDQQAAPNLARNSLAQSPGPTPFRLMLHPAQLAQIAAQFQVHTVSRGTNAYIINGDRYAANTARDSRQLATSGKLDAAKISRDNAALSPAPAAGAPAAADQSHATATAERLTKTLPPATPRHSEFKTETGQNSELPAPAGPRSEAAPSPTAQPAAEFRAEKFADQKARPNEESLARTQKDTLKELPEPQRTKDALTAQSPRPDAGQKAQPSISKTEDQWIECIITMEPAPPDTAK